ncbi:family 71 glycosyltransferase [Colletotrichum truncatum]|uniref:Family 71 glycosyltransferase n=1 Tax=Colletotrichum truncatum TaxID=5467 RepID=A0ACC3YPA2_COLTU
MLAGSTVCMAPKFRVSTFWDDIRESHATWFVYVGETLRYLVAAPPSPRDKEHSIHTVLGNGCRPDVWKRFLERFGVDAICEFYNSTEGVLDLRNLSRGDFLAHAVGHYGLLLRLRYRNMIVPVAIDTETGDVKRDPKTGLAVRMPYEVGGEILVAHPGERAFPGYFNNTDATDKKFVKDVLKKGDTFYRTGDSLKRDGDGKWYFLDRLGDTYRWKGENVSTAEVSEVLGSYPGVNEAVVYGVSLPGHDGKAGAAALDIAADRKESFDFADFLRSGDANSDSQSAQWTESLSPEQPQSDANPRIDMPPPDHVEIPIVDKNANAQLPAQEAQLAFDAHKLATADEFLPHFAAVIIEKGISQKQARATCTWPADTYVDFQFSDSVEWVLEDRPVLEIELRRREWHDFVKSGMIPYTSVKDRFFGRGLVIVAGNADTIMRVKVILRQLKKLGSSIPIEIHYWDNEMDIGVMADLNALYTPIYYNDLSKEHNIVHIKKDGYFGINYQLKTAALLNARWAEPILLDSDNIPILDPATLYDSVQYQEYHSVFWPDIARTRPQNPAWAIFNTPCRMAEYEQESGQLLVDKTRFWYHLQLASWLNNEQGKYYNEMLLGDKDMFRFAWHALKTNFGKPKKWLTSVGTENDGFYCGHSFAQHHPDDGRVAFLHGGLLKTVSLEVMRWNRDVKGGYLRHYKKASSEESPEVNVNVAIKFDGAAYMPDHSEKFQAAQCTDMFDVEARDMNEILPGFEQTFREIGGYWQLDQEDVVRFSHSDFPQKR